VSVDCSEFRRRVGAEPHLLDQDSRTHMLGCAGCGEWRRTTLQLDDRVAAALRVPVPDGAGAAPVLRFPAVARRRWIALAASIAGGVAIGALMWAAAPRATLADDVVRHMAHEPDAMTATAAADPDAVAAVLKDAGVRLAPTVGTVSYASTCRFRGEDVPHLVVQGADGPVTVMILRHERVAASERFDEDGYAGTIVPVGSGSIAVIGRAPEPGLAAYAARVAASVGWE
jgi:hypothetical protein